MEGEDYVPTFNIGKNRKIIIVLIVGILIVGGIGALVYSKYTEGSPSFTKTLTEGVASKGGSLANFEAAKSGANPHFLIENVSGTELFKVEHGGNVYLAELKNCDTFDTDASGKLTCGIDYDTNVTTECSGDEALLGNSTCFSIVDIDTDTTYTAGSNLSLDGTTFSLDEANVETWLDTLYGRTDSENTWAEDQTLSEDLILAQDKYTHYGEGEGNITGNGTCTIIKGSTSTFYVC